MRLGRANNADVQTVVEILLCRLDMRIKILPLGRNEMFQRIDTSHMRH